MKKDKKDLTSGLRDQKGLDKRSGKDSLKEDVRLTDKKGDNLKEDKQSGFDEFMDISGNSGGPSL